MKPSLKILKEKAHWVRKQTLRLHKRAPETRLASSLSCVEIFVVLYYAKLLRFNPKQLQWEGRDRLIVSKGHGAVSLYPILADLDFFDRAELSKIGRPDSFLGVIPDTTVPGFETINGSLGHGLGVASGMALALKRKAVDAKVFVLCGDGELNAGAVWEAIAFAAFRKLDNLILIIDNNKMSMLGYQKEILGLEPLPEKFNAFHWKSESVNGHNIEQLYGRLSALKKDKSNKPKVLVANTRKGKGVPILENDPLCHIRTLSAQEVNSLLKEWK